MTFFLLLAALQETPTDDERRLAEFLRFETKVDVALAKAKAEKKLVLAWVQGAFESPRPTFDETVLGATVLIHPDVLGILRARYVAVRVYYNPMAYMHDLKEPDPLAPLGTTRAKTKGPALVISDANGRHLATLASIGTWDLDLALRFLLAPLPKIEGTDPWKLLAAGELDGAQALFEKKPYGLSRVAALRGNHEEALSHLRWLEDADASTQAGVSALRLGRHEKARAYLARAVQGKGTRRAEASYHLACLLPPKEADALWKSIVRDHPDSPWALKARARTGEWKERMIQFENLVAFAIPREATGTEHAARLEEILPRAVDALLSMQAEDGSWSMAALDPDRAAVTALAAHALRVWMDELKDPRKGIASKAADRADRWLRQYVRSADPKNASSFGTTYVLEYFLVRGGADEIKKAIALHLGGQCPNGAWSYTYAFGTGWKGGFGGWPKTDRGRVHSMNTGPALLALARAKKLGHDVDAKALHRGIDALLRMRKASAVYTYTWPDPICYDTLEYSIGRAPACEQALLMLGAADATGADAALDAFLKGRAALRLPVKLTESHGSPAGSSAYFYFFAYYHAARLLELRGKDATCLRDDLLAVAELDGTWVDWSQAGKAYGTAAALLILRIAK